MRHFVSDSVRFWRRTPLRGLVILLGCAVVVALTAVNAVMLRSSLWFSPPGTDSSITYFTLGQYTESGAFEPLARTDLLGLESLFEHPEYSAYCPWGGDIGFRGRSWQRSELALVSDSFFGLMGVALAQGAPLRPDNRGAVLSHEFWRRELSADPAAVGQSISLDGVSLPVVGIAASGFAGLGEGRPDAWISDVYLSEYLQLELPIPPTAIDAVTREFVQFAPMCYGLLSSDSINHDIGGLSEWTVRDSASITLNAPTGALTLGLDAQGHRAAVLPRIDLVPGRTAVVSRYLRILAALNMVLMVLALLNLAAFWTARTSERGQELQTRVAIGARRGDLLGLFAAEAAPFLLLMLLLAVPLAALQLDLLKATPPFDSYLDARDISLTAFDFLPGLGIVLCLGVIAVLLPWFYLHNNLLRARALGVTRATKRGRVLSGWLQWALSTVAAIALATSLLVGIRLAQAGWGGGNDPWLIQLHAANGDLTDRILSALQLDPTTTDMIETPPLTALQIRGTASLVGGGGGTEIDLYFNHATPGGFAVLGLAMLHGKAMQRYSESDIVLSEAAAATLAGTADLSTLIGRRLLRANLFDASRDQTYEIVGIVENAHYSDVRNPPEMVGYLSPRGTTGDGNTLLLAQEDAGRIDRALAQAGAEGDAEVGRILASAPRISEVAAGQVNTELLLAIFTAAYALVALGLICLGILAQARTQLTQQRRELALRTAMGATRRRSTVEFLRTPLAVAVAGVVPILSSASVWLIAGSTSHMMLFPQDWKWLGLTVALVVGLFVLALFVLVSRTLASTNLSELLRVER